jgi:lipid-binding SYLF domain-containing protein
MKKKIRNIGNIVLAVSVIAAFSTLTAQAADDLRSESRQAVAEFLKADSSLQRFLADSSGYAIFPSVGKGGLVVGGAHGKGLVYENTNIIGQATMTQASIGAQVGGQSFAEVIFFETPAALNDFKSGKFEMSAEVSAVVATEGASQTAKYKQGVAVFTKAKQGLMVQASIGGQKFTFEPQALEPTGRTSPKSNN